MIHSVKGSQRLDSRGNPTVQVTLVTKNGSFRSIVPSGASTGKHEAVELRDNNERMYNGKGVTQAIQNIDTIIGPALIDQKFDVKTQLKEIDHFMTQLDGTPNKSRLGANAILAVSMACARAGAAAAGIPLYQFLRRQLGEADEKSYVLPVPFFNVLNGGAHSGNKMAFQEFMIAPIGAASVEEAVRMASETYHHLKRILSDKFGPSATGIGDEGGFAPPITTPQQALDLLEEAVDKAGHGGHICFAIDPASSEFFGANRTYDLGFKDKEASNVYSSQRLQELYISVLSRYPVTLLEDPFAEDDWLSWKEFQKLCKVELVGDDLLVTNKERIRMAKEKGACNSLLLKMNQIGSVSETIEAASLAYSYGWKVFVSHRSGETTDDFIADLTVGLGTGHLKSGAPCRGERVVKYNRLMDIEAELTGNGGSYSYAGESHSWPKQF